RSSMRTGQTVTVKFAGQNGYEAETLHVLTADDLDTGSISLTLLPPPGDGPFPEGASTITAEIDGGTISPPTSFTIDTVPPAAPVLTLAGNLLTIATEPDSEVTVDVNIGGVNATVTVMADNNGLAS